MGVFAEHTGSTSAGQPFRRWKIICAQPGRREVDHMPARKGVMPAKSTRRRACGRWCVGSGSQSGMMQGSSARSLCVSAVSAIEWG